MQLERIYQHHQRSPVLPFDGNQLLYEVRDCNAITILLIHQLFYICDCGSTHQIVGADTEILIDNRLSLAAGAYRTAKEATGRTGSLSP